MIICCKPLRNHLLNWQWDWLCECYVAVKASISSGTESSPTKPSTLPRTSSLVKQRTPSDPRSGIPDVNGKLLIKEHVRSREEVLIYMYLKRKQFEGKVWIQMKEQLPQNYKYHTGKWHFWISQLTCKSHADWHFFPDHVLKIRPPPIQISDGSFTTLMSDFDSKVW